MKKTVSCILGFIFLGLSGCTGFVKNPQETSGVETIQNETTSLFASIETTRQIETTSSTRNVETTSMARTIDETQNKEKVQAEIDGLYRLGQSPKDFLHSLKTEGISVYKDMSLEPDGRITEWDGYFWYKTDEMYVWFNPSGQVIALSVLTPRYATDLGIRVGDSKEKMLEAYGNNYTNDESEGFWYFYTYGDLCIGFLVYDTVYWWSISIPSDQPSPP